MSSNEIKFDRLTEEKARLLDEAIMKDLVEDSKEKINEDRYWMAGPTADDFLIEPLRKIEAGSNITISDCNDWSVICTTTPNQINIPIIEYTDFDKHLAYILDKSKAELADKVMEIGEGKFKVEDIEAKLEQIIRLVKGDLFC